MPWSDPQFWIVTVAFVWGAWVILREIVPGIGGKNDSSSCGNCATGAAACARPEPPRLESELPVVRAPR